MEHYGRSVHSPSTGGRCKNRLSDVCCDQLRASRERLHIVHKDALRSGLSALTRIRLRQYFDHFLMALPDEAMLNARVEAGVMNETELFYFQNRVPVDDPTMEKSWRKPSKDERNRSFCKAAARQQGGLRKQALRGLISRGDRMAHPARRNSANAQRRQRFMHPSYRLSLVHHEQECRKAASS